MSAGASLTEDFCWELRRAFRELSLAADQELAPLGITVSDRALLEHLARESGPISISELARQRSVSRQHIHQSLKKLKDPSWIEARPDPEDARQLLLRLGARGRAFWRKVRRVDERFFKRLSRSLTVEDADRAIEALRKVRQALPQPGRAE